MTEFPADPIPGYYRRRLVKRGRMVGPWVPVHIWRGFGTDPLTGDVLERGWMLRAKRFDQEVDPETEWFACWREPITKEEYDYLVAIHAYAITHEPTLPEACPKQVVDLNSLKSLY